MTLDDLPTPCLVVDRARLEKNLKAMQEKADANRVALRPHVKTHKAIALARLQTELGARGITVAKVGEAERFTGAGFEDVRIAYAVIGSDKYARLADLMESARLSFCIDTIDGATAASEFFHERGLAVDVLLEVNSGHNRCGVNPTDPRSVELAKEIAELPGLRLAGILTHAGHAYHGPAASDPQDDAAPAARDPQDESAPPDGESLDESAPPDGESQDELDPADGESQDESDPADGKSQDESGPADGKSLKEALRRVSNHERDVMLDFASRLRDEGLAAPGEFEISIGSTPTMRYFENRDVDGFRITEIRPGNYVFNDAIQHTLGVAKLDQCALTVLTTIISRHRNSGRERLFADAGKKVLTSDTGARTRGFGILLYNARTMQPLPHAEITGLSEEHAWIGVSGGSTLAVGNRIRLVPNHACVTVNTQDLLYVVEGDEVVDSWPVDARGAVI